MTTRAPAEQIGRIDPTAIRAVVFDFDGTLAETEIDFALMRQRVLDIAEQWGLADRLNPRRYILEIVDDALELLLEEGDRTLFSEETARAMSEVELLSTSVASPFPGVPEMLELLRERDVRVGIITRNCREGVASVLSRHPMHHEVLLTRDDVERVKPDPAHLYEALEVLGVEPGAALMVGDHITDIEVGKAAGTLTAGVLTAGTEREQFEELEADVVLASAADVSSLFRVEAGEEA